MVKKPKNKIEKFIATKMPGIASGAVCLKKHDRAINILFDGITRWLIMLENKYSPDFFEIIKDAQIKLGYEIAKQLKDEYQLGNDITDALDLMWMLIIPFGIKMKAKKIGEGRVREEKLACPIFDVFRKHGVDYCEQLCVSLGNGWLKAINPKFKFELVRRGDNDHYCLKDIVDTSKTKKEE